jgi:hypothetical protein
MSSSSRIEELEKKYAESPRRFFAPLANEFRKLGDTGRAIELCRAHLEQQPNHMSGQVVLGQALFDAGQRDEARSAFETALSLDPENIIALRHLGDLARSSGELGAARNWYSRLLDLDSRNHEVIATVREIDEILAVQTLDTPVEGSEEPAAVGATELPVETISDRWAEALETTPVTEQPEASEPETMPADLPDLQAAPDVAMEVVSATEGPTVEPLPDAVDEPRAILEAEPAAELAAEPEAELAAEPSAEPEAELEQVEEFWSVTEELPAEVREEWSHEAEEYTAPAGSSPSLFGDASPVEESLALSSEVSDEVSDDEVLSYESTEAAAAEPFGDADQLEAEFVAAEMTSPESQSDSVADAEAPRQPAAEEWLDPALHNEIRASAEALAEVA